MHLLRHEENPESTDLGEHVVPDLDSHLRLSCEKRKRSSRTPND